MKNYIVLIKQVPDLSDIKENVFDAKTGNLLRGKLSSVINPMDEEALALAERMRRLNGGKGKIVLLSMGPPKAENILRRCLTRTAEIAVLLTDSKLAGSDTQATAIALNCAINKIISELFDGNKNCYIYCGVQSTDGDTAQVPIQVAAALDAPVIAYVSDVKIDKATGKTVFIRHLNRKKEEIEVKSTNASVLITVSGYKHKLFASVGRTLELSKIPFLKWNAEDIACPGKGIENSRTRVIKIFQPNPLTRKGEQLQDISQLREVIQKYCRKTLSDRKNKISETSDCGIKENTEKVQLSKEEIWVFAEWDESDYNQITYELINHARKLADSLCVQLAVITEKEKNVDILVAMGADKVYCLNNTDVLKPDVVGYCQGLASIVKRYRPQIFLFGATQTGRLLAPALAYFIKCGLTADCTSLELFDSICSDEYGILLQTRPALGGNIMASIRSVNSFCQMATVRAGVFKKKLPDKSRKGKILYEDISLFTDIKPRIDITASKISNELTLLNAPVIVSGGRGLKTGGSFNNLIPVLANKISNSGNIHVQYTGSRGAVDYGFIDRERQVGQTGTTVAPVIYLAIGISGAIQHMVGISKSEIIIAINNDPNAPILKQSDYFIIGEAEKIVPKLISDLIKGDAK